jgi:hypothetical protein
VLSCYDRVIVTKTLPTVCYEEGMTRFLCASAIRIFDCPVFAQTLRERVRDGAAQLAVETGVTIGPSPRAISATKQLFSASRSDAAITPAWFTSSRRWRLMTPICPGTTRRPIRPRSAPTAVKCLHYSFYFMDAAFGLIYLRVPTPVPSAILLQRS